MKVDLITDENGNLIMPIPEELLEQVLQCTGQLV
jgi:hypothetical protein